MDEVIVVEVCGMAEDEETVVTEVEWHMVEVVVTVETVGELVTQGDNMEEDWEKSSVSLSSCSLLWGGWNRGGVHGWIGRHFTWKRP